MELVEAPYVSHGVRGSSWLVKIILYFISFLVVCSKTLNIYVVGLDLQVLECKLNPYWSKLRLKEKHDVMLFFFSSHVLRIQKRFLRKNGTPFSFICCWDIPFFLTYWGYWGCPLISSWLAGSQLLRLYPSTQAQNHPDPLLASQSDALIIAPHRDFRSPSHPLIAQKHVCPDILWIESHLKIPTMQWNKNYLFRKVGLIRTTMWCE